jgi:hypothetical protein
MQGTINMATIAISALPSATAAATTDVLPIVQGGTTKQVTNALLFTNSTLVTPVLGTPASGTLTNCTGLPIATGISGLASGIATFLATPSSANLRTALTDETGTGSAVFATTPTLVTPEIGVATGTSLTLSGLNATNAAAPTIASATTIAPTKQITFISGTTVIVNITAPSPISAGGGIIRLIPTGVFTWTAAGNIALAGTAVVSKTLTMTYDVTTAKWYPSYTA